MTTADKGEVTQRDVLLALDTAAASLLQARRMVELYQAQPTTDDGTCKHMRQRPTFTGTVCMDCGDELTAKAPEGDHGVATPDDSQRPL